MKRDKLTDAIDEAIRRIDVALDHYKKETK